MQSTSALFKTMLAEGAPKEWRCIVAGESYGQDRIVSAEASAASMEKAAEIGRCMAKELHLTLREPGAIPRMAQIKAQVRLNDGTRQSEWIDKGTFFVDTRAKDPFGKLTLNAFDPMLKTDQPYLEQSTLSTWPADEADVVDEIADLIGVTVDARTALAGYEVPIPEQDWTMREVLGWIAAANGGNWVITPANELYLISFEGITSLLGKDSANALLLGDSFIVLSTGIKYEDQRDLLGEDSTAAIKFGSDFLVLNGRGESRSNYVGTNGQDIRRNAESLQNLGLLQPFSGVKLWRSHEATYVDEIHETEIDGAISAERVQVEVEQSVVAGDDEGRVLEADCPWATQAMADTILAKIVGYCYQGAAAAGALVSPAVELGDICICDGVSFFVSQIRETFDALYAPTLSATGDDEVDHEYPFETKLERTVNRKVSLGENYYGFRVTRENGIEVDNIVDGVATTRMILNSNEQKFFDADGNLALYFDPVVRKYKFAGDVIIGPGYHVRSSKFAIFPFDAEDEEMDAETVPDGFNLYGWSSDQLYNFLKIYQNGLYTNFSSPGGGNAQWDFAQTDVQNRVNLYGQSYYYGSGQTGNDAEIATLGDIPTLPTTGPWKASAFEISANTNKYIKVARDPNRLRTGMFWLLSSTANKNGYYMFVRGTSSTGAITLTTIKAVTQSGMSVSVSTQDTDYIAISGATGYIYGVLVWFSGDKPEVVSTLPTST